MAEAGKNGPLQIQTGSEEALDLGKRFQNIQPLGYGAGGLVYSARDLQSARNVSVKKISLQDQRSWRQALRELKILRRLKHENVVSLFDVLDDSGATLKLGAGEGVENVKSLFFIQELMDTNLKYLIDSRQLSSAHVRLLMYQLLRGLKYLHSANVLHRDLKPANLFVNCDTLLLKIGDFGTSRIVDPEYSHAGHLTASVGTCWYRSPESILTPRDYTKSTDIWSVGCIMVHCLLGAPLFPGIHELDQLRHVIDCVELSDRDWSRVLRVMPNKLLKNHPFRPRVPLHTRLLGVDARAQSLLEAMLTFDADSRMTAEAALTHPYFEAYSSLNNEPLAESPFHIEHEVDDLPLPELQSLLIAENTINMKIPSDTTCADRDLSPRESLHSDPEATINEDIGNVDDDELNDQSPRSIEVPGSSEVSHREDTHTLEEIFQAPYHSPPLYAFPMYPATCYASTSPHASVVSARSLLESKNAKNKVSEVERMERENKKNAENSQRQTTPVASPSPAENNIKAAVESSEIKHKVQRKDSLKKNEEDEEKDVAECSPSKLREDLELGINQMMSRAQALALDVEHFERLNGAKVVNEDDQQESSEQVLLVEVQDTENMKEFLQPSPKELSPSASAFSVRMVDAESRQQVEGVENHLVRPRGATGAIRGPPRPQTDLNKEQYYKKQRLKEETQNVISRKLILDKIESEKETNHSTLSSEELDELYRLPTDHLAINRDLSNQRLKRQTLLARNPLPHGHLRYQRRSKHDVSDRLNDDKLYHVEGACGGDEHSPELSDHSESDDFVHNILYDSVNSALIQPHSTFSNQVTTTPTGYDIDISLDVLPAANPTPAAVSRDPLSSPESPPSPSGGRSGARPKKSPKKQRAL